MSVIGMVGGVSQKTVDRVFEVLPDVPFTAIDIVNLTNVSKSTVSRALHCLVLAKRIERVSRQRVRNIDTGEHYEINNSDRKRNETLVAHLPTTFRKTDK
jgi:predicted transcriptional regulator